MHITCLINYQFYIAFGYSMTETIMGKYGPTLATIGAGACAVVAAPAVLGAAGFTTTGVVAGSLAAGILVQQHK